MYCYSLWYRPLLKQIKNSAEAHIVLDCSTDNIYEVLKQAQQIGMMSDYHSYLITSLVSGVVYCLYIILLYRIIYVFIYRIYILLNWMNSNMVVQI